MLEFIGLTALIAGGLYAFFYLMGTSTVRRAASRVEAVAGWMDDFALSQGISGNKDRADFATVAALYLRDGVNSVRAGRLTAPEDLEKQVEIFAKFTTRPDALSAALPHNEKHALPQYVEALKVVGGQLVRIARKG